MAEIDDVSTERNSLEIDRSIIPQSPRDIFEETFSEIDVMEQEGTQPMIAESIARKQFNRMAVNSPPGFSFANDIHCSGASLSMGSAGKLKTASFSGAGGGTSPASGASIEGVTQAGNTTTVATFDNTTHKERLGRLNGYNGWGKFGDSTHMAFASFEHNFQVLLMGYADVPSLPVNSDWQLPNMVVSPNIQNIEDRYNASIKVPENMAPSARYSFSHAAPTPFVRFNIETTVSNSDTKMYVQVMDSNKNSVAVTNEIEVPEGNATTSVAVRGSPLEIKSGYLNINPSNAPEGITVNSVSSFPPGLI